MKTMLGMFSSSSLQRLMWYPWEPVDNAEAMWVDAQRLVLWVLSSPSIVVMMMVSSSRSYEGWQCACEQCNVKFGNVCDVYIAVCDFLAMWYGWRSCVMAGYLWSCVLVMGKCEALCMLSSVFLVCSNTMEFWQWAECRQACWRKNSLLAWALAACSWPLALTLWNADESPALEFNVELWSWLYRDVGNGHSEDIVCVYGGLCVLCVVLMCVWRSWV